MDRAAKSKFRDREKAGALQDWAVERGFLRINVARRLKPLKSEKIGFHSSSEKEAKRVGHAARRVARARRERRSQP